MSNRRYGVVTNTALVALIVGALSADRGWLPEWAGACVAVAAASVAVVAYSRRHWRDSVEEPIEQDCGDEQSDVTTATTALTDYPTTVSKIIDVLREDFEISSGKKIVAYMPLFGAQSGAPFWTPKYGDDVFDIIDRMNEPEQFDVVLTPEGDLRVQQHRRFVSRRVEASRKTSEKSLIGELETTH